MLAVFLILVIVAGYYAILPSKTSSEISAQGVSLGPTQAVNTTPKIQSVTATSIETGLTQPAPPAAPIEAASDPWHKYPGTLNDQVLRAFSHQDGQMAFDVADLLGTCELFEMVKQKNKSLHNVQTEYANCQTLQGKLHETMLDLLDLAREKHIKGAAIFSFVYERKSPAIIQAVIGDAYAGHSTTIAYMSDSKPEEFGLTTLQQTTLIYALKLAANDPEVGESLQFALEWAEAAAYRAGWSKTKNFEPSGLNDAAKAEARTIAERIITQAKLKSKI